MTDVEQQQNQEDQLTDTMIVLAVVFRTYSISLASSVHHYTSMVVCAAKYIKLRNRAFASLGIELIVYYVW